VTREAGIPVPPVDLQHSVASVRDRLRAAIMSGEMAPGQVLSQVDLARGFGVSRTPLREALRMLQEEGLITAELNKRARVAVPNADELELIYSTRLLLSALATAITVPLMTRADSADMAAAVAAMRSATDRNDVDAWRRADRAFHHTHMARGSARLRGEVEGLFERASQYRAIWLRDEPHRQAMILADHEAILRASQARDTDAAVRGVTKHLSRIALTILAYIDPAHEPVTLRQAVRLADAGRANFATG